MCPLPVDPSARQRLLDAQRAEADALNVVERAQRARDRLQAKLDAAAAAVDDARYEVIKVSGLARAALLLNEEEAVLRRATRLARSRDQKK